MRLLILVALLGITARPARGQVAPRGDHHQHLFSPATAALVTGQPQSPGISATQLIALLDSAGIARALVLSTAYTWASVNRAPVPNEYERVREDNDWTARQVAGFPGRLRAFCSVNPLKSWALEEVARCARDAQLRQGLKLHFGNSDVDLDQPEHVAQVRGVLEAANRSGMAVVAHVRTSINRGRNYGTRQAQVILDQLLPAVPDVPFQIAHLAGSGGYAANSGPDSALVVLIAAIAAKDARVKNLWFDVSGVVNADFAPALAQLVATRLRQAGVGRLLFGTDTPVGTHTPRSAWADFRQLPLSEAEFTTIANNVAPYLAWP